MTNDKLNNTNFRNKPNSDSSSFLPSFTLPTSFNPFSTQQTGEPDQKPYEKEKSEEETATSWLETPTQWMKDKFGSEKEPEISPLLAIPPGLEIPTHPKEEMQEAIKLGVPSEKVVEKDNELSFDGEYPKAIIVEKPKSALQRKQKKTRIIDKIPTRPSHIEAERSKETVLAKSSESSISLSNSLLVTSLSWIQADMTLGASKSTSKSSEKIIEQLDYSFKERARQKIENHFKSQDSIESLFEVIHTRLEGIEEAVKDIPVNADPEYRSAHDYFELNLSTVKDILKQVNKLREEKKSELALNKFLATELANKPPFDQPEDHLFISFSNCLNHLTGRVNGDLTTLKTIITDIDKRLLSLSDKNRTIIAKLNEKQNSLKISEEQLQNLGCFICNPNIGNTLLNANHKEPIIRVDILEYQYQCWLKFYNIDFKIILSEKPLDERKVTEIIEALYFLSITRETHQTIDDISKIYSNLKADLPHKIIELQKTLKKIDESQLKALSWFLRNIALGNDLLKANGKKPITATQTLGIQFQLLTKMIYMDFESLDHANLFEHENVNTIIDSLYNSPITEKINQTLVDITTIFSTLPGPIFEKDEDAEEIRALIKTYNTQYSALYDVENNQLDIITTLKETAIDIKSLRDNHAFKNEVKKKYENNVAQFEKECPESSDIIFLREAYLRAWEKMRKSLVFIDAITKEEMENQKNQQLEPKKAVINNIIEADNTLKKVDKKRTDMIDEITYLIQSYELVINDPFTNVPDDNPGKALLINLKKDINNQRDNLSELLNLLNETTLNQGEYYLGIQEVIHNDEKQSKFIIDIKLDEIAEEIRNLKNTRKKRFEVSLNKAKNLDPAHRTPIVRALNRIAGFLGIKTNRFTLFNQEQQKQFHTQLEKYNDYTNYDDEREEAKTAYQNDTISLSPKK